MNRNTLELMFREVPSWNDPVNGGAREAFAHELCGRGRKYQFGYDDALEAWGYFLAGWIQGQSHRG